MADPIVDIGTSLISAAAKDPAARDAAAAFINAAASSPAATEAAKTAASSPAAKAAIDQIAQQASASAANEANKMLKTLAIGGGVAVAVLAAGWYFLRNKKS